MIVTDTAPTGGAGFTRRCEILKDDVQLAIYSDRFRLAPEGLLGGEPGQRGYCRIHRANGTVEELKSKAAVDLGKGDVVDRAFASFARAYADQTEADHEALTDAVRSGRLAAEHGV